MLLVGEIYDTREYALNSRYVDMRNSRWRLLVFISRDATWGDQYWAHGAQKKNTMDNANISRKAEENTEPCKSEILLRELGPVGPVGMVDTLFRLVWAAISPGAVVISLLLGFESMA